MVSDAAYSSDWNADADNAPSKNAVYDKLNSMDAFNAIGTANAQWMQCIYEFYSANRFKNVAGIRYTIAASGVNTGAYFAIPLPTNKGGLKLYIKSFELALYDADSTDCIQDFDLYGLSGQSTSTKLYGDSTDRVAPGVYTYTPGAPLDCSSYDRMMIDIYVKSTTATDFDMAYIKVEYYYDT